MLTTPGVASGHQVATTHEVASRLCDLVELGLISHGDGAGPARDRLTRLAARAAALLTTPTCLVTAVLPGAVVVLAGHGMSGLIAHAGGVPAEWSFCTEVARTGLPVTICDTRGTPTARDNPLVQVDRLYAYLGVPLMTRRGNVLGALCVTDTRTRRFTGADIGTLTRLATEAMATIETTRVPAC